MMKYWKEIALVVAVFVVIGAITLAAKYRGEGIALKKIADDNYSAWVKAELERQKVVSATADSISRLRAQADYNGARADSIARIRPAATTRAIQVASNIQDVALRDSVISAIREDNRLADAENSELRAKAARLDSAWTKEHTLRIAAEESLKQLQVTWDSEHQARLAFEKAAGLDLGFIERHKGFVKGVGVGIVVTTIVRGALSH